MLAGRCEFGGSFRALWWLSWFMMEDSRHAVRRSLVSVVCSLRRLPVLVAYGTWYVGYLYSLSTESRYRYLVLVPVRESGCVLCVAIDFGYVPIAPDVTNTNPKKNRTTGK
jgi:hypothetical protein